MDSRRSFFKTFLSGIGLAATAAAVDTMPEPQVPAASVIEPPKTFHDTCEPKQVPVAPVAPIAPIAEKDFVYRKPLRGAVLPLVDKIRDKSFGYSGGKFQSTPEAYSPELAELEYQLTQCGHKFQGANCTSGFQLVSGGLHTMCNLCLHERIYPKNMIDTLVHLGPDGWSKTNKPHWPQEGKSGDGYDLAVSDHIRHGGIGLR